MHDHSTHGREEGGRRLLFTLVTTFLIMLAEIIGGVLSGSLALLSDAAHMAFDMCAILVGYIAMRIGRRPPDLHNTYGLRRAEPLAALINGLLLLVVAIGISVEGVRRLMAPAEVHSTMMLAVACVGLAANAIGMMALHHHRHDTENLRAVFLHLKWDLISSVGVIVGALGIRLTGWVMIDPLLSIGISAIIGVSAVRLIANTLHILVEGVPANMNLYAILQDMVLIPGVVAVHDPHLTASSGSDYIFTAHVVIDPSRTDAALAILSELRTMLHEHHGIHHATLEPETTGMGGHAHCLPATI